MGLGDVNREAIPSKEADQDVHQVLYPLRVSGSNHAVISVKDLQAPPNGLSHPVVGHPLVLHCHGQPCPDDIFQNHIEDCRRYEATLRRFPCCWEGRPVIAILTWNHFLVGPESLQESTYARSCAVSFQGMDEAFPVQGVLFLP